LFKYGWNNSALKQIVTWLVALLTFAIACLFLEDLTVIDLDDPDDDMNIHVDNEALKKPDESKNNLYQAVALDDESEVILQPAKSMFDRQLLEQWLPFDRQQTTKQQFNGYKVFNTIHTTNSIDQSTPIQGALRFIKQLLSVLRLRNSWRVIVFSFASVTVALQWTASDISLPPFLERRFGEQIPIYTIQNIHMMGCMILPPIVGALTTGIEDFKVIMPGLWIMAVSPLMLVLSPTVIGACAWQIVLTVGQVLWAPRQDSWTASLAPTGMEGLFFAVSCSRALLVPLGDYAMGMMNSKYNKNCPECRDSYGHFCDKELFNDDILTCKSAQETCDIYINSSQQTCPSTCNECPTWEYSDPAALWFILMLVSILSPVLVWLFLPFLRGYHGIFYRCRCFRNA
jgi:predicted nucleic acid-binding Zn ribbon protein